MDKTENEVVTPLIQLAEEEYWKYFFQKIH